MWEQLTKKGYEITNKRISAWFELVGGGLGNTKSCKKIIAGTDTLPTLSYSDEVKQILRDKYGWVDVEELASLYLEKEYEGMNIEGTLLLNSKDDFIKGFKTHQSISNKMFSLEDLKKAIKFGSEESGCFDSISDEQFIQSLQQPIQLNVEVDMAFEGEENVCKEKCEWSQCHSVAECKHVNENMYKPKIANNSILVTKIL